MLDDISWGKLLIIGVVAVIVIAPMVTRWIDKVRGARS